MKKIPHYAVKALYRHLTMQDTLKSWIGKGFTAEDRKPKTGDTCLINVDGDLYFAILQSEAYYTAGAISIRVEDVSRAVVIE